MEQTWLVEMRLLPRPCPPLLLLAVPAPGLPSTVSCPAAAAAAEASVVPAKLEGGVRYEREFEAAFDARWRSRRGVEVRKEVSLRRPCWPPASLAPTAAPVVAPSAPSSKISSWPSRMT